MDNDILVSICCITYNHEKFIKEALDSFLNQKVNFKYEIIIHDDASTDNTAYIIRQYEEKYPNIIRPIYQTENQYSKNNKISANFVYPKARGKYIALCEGDDFWIDENKLQLQVDFLEKNLDYSLCVHPSKCIDYNTNKMHRIGAYKKNTTIDIEKFLSDFIINDYKMLFQTSSILCRTKYIKDLIDSGIDFYYDCCVGDLPLELFLGLKGKFFYINKEMSVYRINTPSSWTTNQYNNDIKAIQIYQNLENTMIQFNQYTEGRYIKYIEQFILRYEFYCALRKKDYKTILDKKYRNYFKKLYWKSKIIFILYYRFPMIMKIYERLRIE